FQSDRLFELEWQGVVDCAVRLNLQCTLVKIRLRRHAIASCSLVMLLRHCFSHLNSGFQTIDMNTDSSLFYLRDKWIQRTRLTRARSMISSPRPLRTAFIMKKLKPLACSKVIVGCIESS